MGSEKDEAFYDEVYSKDYNVAMYDYVYLEVIELIKYYKIGSVLDVGCGLGRLAELIDQQIQYVNYFGFDFSKTAIEYATQKYSELCCVFYEGNVYDKKSYDYAHDAVIFVEVLEHVDDIKALNNVTSGKWVIASLPTFDSEGHVRTYPNIKCIIERFESVIDIMLLKKLDKNIFLLAGKKW